MEENNNNIVIYQTDDGTTKIDVKLEDETVWLSQQQMADLYDTTKQNISLHIKNIFDEEELDINSTVKEFLTVQKEGNRKVERKVKYYNLNYKNNIGHIYTKEEIEVILDRFKNNKVFVCAFLTACYTGMKTGEVFALTWDDIDLENRTIKINKTVYGKDREENGRWYLGIVKTICSHREVYICDTLYSVLSNYKNLQVKYKKRILQKV